jgi:catechol 2,3-dioxygenase-like lactoylglutathione lyase family enzyme
MKGISHLTFIVQDLQRMSTLLCEGLGAIEIYDSAERNFSLSREKFFMLADTWIVAMQGELLHDRSYQHVAFAVSAQDLPRYRARLAAIGVEFREPRSRVEGEGDSIYFYDFDNHLFELHSGTLEDRLHAYRTSGGA